MRIGIDISQIAYAGTGVANLTRKLVEHLLTSDTENEYILFFSSLRRKYQVSSIKYKVLDRNVKVKTFKFPPLLLDLLWNRLHILPIEWLIGPVDVFVSSDWTQPPSKKAKLVTILYDLIIYKYPEETDKRIIETQKRRMKWVKKECDTVICISEATKRDAKEILNIPEDKLFVVYPGV